MPGRLNMSLYPLFYGSDVFFGVLKILTHISVRASDETITRRLAWLCMHRPATVLNACRDVVGSAVGLGVL